MDKELKKFYKENSIPPDASLSESAKLRVKNRVISNLGVQLQPEPTSFWSKFLMHSYVLVPLVVILFIGGTTYASADALPGDALYPLKRQVESARIFIAPTEEAKLELEVNFAQKRLEESERLNNVTSKQESDAKKEKSPPKQENIRHENNNEGWARQNKRIQRDEKIRKDTENALEFLNKTKKDFEGKGNERKAQEIERKVRGYKENLERNKDSTINNSREQYRFELGENWRE